jgi:hypothetical protein
MPVPSAKIATLTTRSGHAVLAASPTSNPARGPSVAIRPRRSDAVRSSAAAAEPIETTSAAPSVRLVSSVHRTRKTAPASAFASSPSESVARPKLWNPRNTSATSVCIAIAITQAARKTTAPAISSES